MAKGAHERVRILCCSHPTKGRGQGGKAGQGAGGGRGGQGGAGWGRGQGGAGWGRGGRQGEHCHTSSELSPREQLSSAPPSFLTIHTPHALTFRPPQLHLVCSPFTFPSCHTSLPLIHPFTSPHTLPTPAAADPSAAASVTDDPPLPAQTPKRRTRSLQVRPPPLQQPQPISRPALPPARPRRRRRRPRAGQRTRTDGRRRPGHADTPPRLRSYSRAPEGERGAWGLSHAEGGGGCMGWLHAEGGGLAY